MQYGALSDSCLLALRTTLPALCLECSPLEQMVEFKFEPYKTRKRTSGAQHYIMVEQALSLSIFSFIYQVPLALTVTKS